MELLKLIVFEKKLIRKQLKLKAAQFLYHFRLMRKCFEGLKAEKAEGERGKDKAIGFYHRNDEFLMEECFVGWKERATMTELERAF
jgi:hypothetical protein